MIWLRWSWRDLRARWLQAAAIAVVIAVGTGMFSGLRSMNTWRAISNDASYEAANTFDLRVSLGAGGFAERGAMLAALNEAASAYVSDAEERLILPAQVSVDADSGAALVPGRIVGVELRDGGPRVNSLHPALGRGLTEADAGQDVIVLERNFAKFYDLPAEGEASLSGGAPVSYVGHALSPEYYLVITPEGGLLGQANFAAAFTSIETAQRVSGMDGRVNDLVIKLSPASDEDAVARALEDRFAEMGGEVSRRLDDPSIKLMVEDVEGDRQFNALLAAVVFGGAALAAFNLAGRVVDAQRREIGVGMALGVPTPLIALRPMLFSAQVALLGVAFGMILGFAISRALGAYLTDFLPLPEWRTPFQLGPFAVAAAAGFAVPFIATLAPVWAGTRVAPIDAIRTGHLAARSGGLEWLLSKMKIPGGALVQIPFRSVARAPRRTLLTCMAIGAVVAVMVTMLGLLDSFTDTLSRIEAETAGDSPDRVEVTFGAFHREDSRVVQSVIGAETAARAEVGIRVGAALAANGAEFPVLLQLSDLDGGLWRPGVLEGSLDSGAPGIAISKTAAESLGAGVGDTATLRHPASNGAGGFVPRETTLPVIAIHAHPTRTNVLADIDDRAALGLDGLANFVQALPAPGAGVDGLKRQAFALPGVGSVQKATVASEALGDQFEQYTGILAFIVAVVAALALLIAYNTASIGMDERRREHATMFAYGVRVRAVLGMAMLESAVLGVLSTLLGLAGGYLLLRWVVAALMPGAFADMGIEIVLTPTALATVAAVGILSAAVAPALAVGKLARMDVPSTLRVME